MHANARDARRGTMRTSDLNPPRAGLNSDPVLYGVAAGLAALFPPVKALKDPAEPAHTERPDRRRKVAGAP
ncbi:hypothetical protein SAMN05216360_112121 [Methylobacterium phyllostachyos]|uniref:Uncharacterized protein n=1 Tax=Methylobacterium phyllostachyos TaxID=582672 RepID=A0A1H0F4P9_9HYPH|nr:hypothetical protein SAMN05216360_112121 [Methylobacterium phyllostachyos]